MKRNILKGAFWVLLSISTVSCSDFLDINPHDSISDAAVWENMDLAEAFLNNCYTYVEGENETVYLSVVIRMNCFIVPAMQRKFIH